MARDSRISDIFYYFEKHTTIASGRTVGRKIGIVQEILCKKLLLTSPRICDCLIYEPKVQGRSSATHKLEFILLQPTFAIELSIGGTVSLTPNLSVSLSRTNPSTQTATIVLVTKKKHRRLVRAGSFLKTGKIAPEITLLIKIVAVDAKKVRFCVLDPKRPIASIESKRVGAQRFSGSEKIGSGIQTIEKAKQASLVAVDFDLQFNGTLLALTQDRTKRPFRSFVVVGNGVHWTMHDLAILETYVDYTFLAKDTTVIRYADFVRKLALANKVDFFKFFMDYFKGMTKTPPDSFVVSGSDFVALRPQNAGSFLTALEQQIQSYPITTV